jgi:hypothetical protein
MWTVTIGTVYRTSNSAGLVAGGRGSGMRAVVNRGLKGAGVIAGAVPMRCHDHYFSLLVNRRHFATRRIYRRFPGVYSTEAALRS